MDGRQRKVVWAEMARRKAQFYPDRKWDEVGLWGLFEWEDISELLEDGRLHTTMLKENETIWVAPSRETWEMEIKPLVDVYSLDELTALAGW